MRMNDDLRRKTVRECVEESERKKRKGRRDGVEGRRENSVNEEKRR
jgi:hypothetical protein